MRDCAFFGGRGKGVERTMQKSNPDIFWQTEKWQKQKITKVCVFFCYFEWKTWKFIAFDFWFYSHLAGGDRYLLLQCLHTSSSFKQFYNFSVCFCSKFFFFPSCRLSRCCDSCRASFCQKKKLHCKNIIFIWYYCRLTFLAIISYSAV